MHVMLDLTTESYPCMEVYMQEALSSVDIPTELVSNYLNAKHRLMEAEQHISLFYEEHYRR